MEPHTRLGQAGKRAVASFIVMTLCFSLGMALIYPLFDFVSLLSPWLLLYLLLLFVAPYVAQTVYFIRYMREAYRELLPGVPRAVPAWFRLLVVLPLQVPVLLPPAWKRGGWVRAAAVLLLLLYAAIAVMAAAGPDMGAAFMLWVVFAGVNILVLSGICGKVLTLRLTGQVLMTVIFLLGGAAADNCWHLHIQERSLDALSGLAELGVPFDRYTLHLATSPGEPGDHGFSEDARELAALEKSLLDKNSDEPQSAGELLERLDRALNECGETATMARIDSLLDRDTQIIFESPDVPLLYDVPEWSEPVRFITRIYSARIRRSATAGDRAAVLRDFERCRRLMQVAADNTRSYLGLLATGAVSAIRLGALGKVLAVNVLTPQDITALDRTLRNDEALMRMVRKKAFMGEAAMHLDTVKLFSGGGLADISSKLYARFPTVVQYVLFKDMVFMADCWSAFFTECINPALEPCRLPPRKEYFPTAAGDFPPYGLVSSIVMGHDQQNYRKSYNTEALLRAARIGLLPENADELLDPFTGKSFIRVDGEIQLAMGHAGETANGLRIYSLGPNGLDDNGLYDFKDRDDIAFEIIRSSSQPR